MPEINKLETALETGEIDWNTFDLSTCQRCKLCNTRTNVVPAKVTPGSKILFIAEAPGQTEDLFGTEPLIGECGRLFDRCLEEVGLNRQNVSIANVVCCRPPDNRDPDREEVKACYDILEQFIKQAKIIWEIKKNFRINS